MVREEIIDEEVSELKREQASPFTQFLSGVPLWLITIIAVILIIGFVSTTAEIKTSDLYITVGVLLLLGFIASKQKMGTRLLTPAEAKALLYQEMKRVQNVENALPRGNIIIGSEYELVYRSRAEEFKKPTPDYYVLSFYIFTSDRSKEFYIAKVDCENGYVRALRESPEGFTIPKSEIRTVIPKQFYEMKKEMQR